LVLTSPMPDIQPFRAFRYGEAQLPSMASVVCPPYDIISSIEQGRLYQKHPHNFVRVELTRGAPHERYAQAAKTWKEWLKKGVIARDERPAIYLYEVRFPSEKSGKLLSRRGFFATLKVVPWGKGVFPHEKTLPTHKADRLKLFKALRVQTSPIQFLFADKGRRGLAWLKKANGGNPWIFFREGDKMEHRLWPIVDKGAIKSLQGLLKKTSIVVADGHHRYETSRAYGEWARGLSTRGRPGLGPGANYIMALFNSSEDPTLEVLPTHRAVGWDKRQFVHLEKWGDCVRVSGFNALKLKGSEVGLYRKGTFYRYRFKVVPPELKGTPHATLPVSLLHGGALKGLGKEDFFFTRKPEEAVTFAKKNKGWAFFLAPNTVQEVLDVSTSGGVMPPKSTYFTPKIPSGLLSHALEGEL
jgi:uncharacterized protein (DUF1015 family)